MLGPDAPVASPVRIRHRASMTTVLIVDDEPHIRTLIEQALEDLTDEGIEIVTAADGDEAIEVVKAHQPRLVFLDVMMPKRNGFDVCRAIKTELGLPDTFVVILTARGQSYDRKAGSDAGADLYLTKPFDPDVVLGHAREALGLGSADPA
jgi:two-component system, OmpR family, alkaline phosphatase synthesis response regulator PhoP